MTPARPSRQRPFSLRRSIRQVSGSFGRRLRTRGGLPGWRLDAAVAAVAVVVLVVVSAHVPVGSGDRALDTSGYGLLVMTGVAMGLCRRLPRSMLAVVSAVQAVFVLRDYPNGPVWITGLIVLAVLGWKTSRRTAIVGAAGLFIALSAAAAVVGHAGVLEPAIYLGWSVAAVLLGDVLRNRRGYLAGQAERARMVERGREEETARRIAEERLRIARDLHDSVAHAMATINVQAGVAAHVLARRPEAAGPALTAIQRASAEVLDELTAMLSLLRDDTGLAEHAPTPGLGELPRLARGSGLDVELTLQGPTQHVPAVIATAAYRVVQESLTNVLRHSQAGTARVRVTAAADAGLLVEIADDGPARPTGAAGTRVGIRGMRERVGATGGVLRAAPVPEGGFLVRAEWAGKRP
jgi:signal transduction histidine kinase